MKKILLVEDEPRVSSFIKKGLEEQRFNVDAVFNGQDAVQAAQDREYDLIVLDIVLPKLTGMEVCREIRNFNKDVPILMLTALGTVEDKVKGLHSGADDYLVKPFHFKEFLARIEAMLRRRRGILKQKVYVLDDLIMDSGSKSVKRGGKSISLTAREFSLLELFLNNVNKVLSRSFIAESVWGLDFETGTNVIDVYINYLRNKLEKGHDKKLIHTVIGMGYVLKSETEGIP